MRNPGRSPGEERVPHTRACLHLHPRTLDNRRGGPQHWCASPLSTAGKWANRDCMLGMEFSGRDRGGRRVMGLVPAEGLATSVLLSPDFLWEVPSSW